MPNLIGFAVGNGVTNWTYDTTPSFVEMGYWHSLYSDSLRKKIQAANCDYGGYAQPNMSAICAAYLVQFEALVHSVNIYNIFGICYGTSDNPALEEGIQKKRGFTAKDYTPWAFVSDEIKAEHGLVGDSLPPCTFGNPIMEYFDDPDVRTALHIPFDAATKPWEMCVGAPAFNYTSLPQASQWIYEELHGKIRMMHFSGDIDGAVGTDGTQAWIDSLNWEITGEWAQWKYNDGTDLGD